MTRYGMRYGSWWAVQWALDRPFALGAHFEHRTLTNSKATITFGPYLDLHVPFLILSIGRRPIYTSDFDLLVSYSRGGNSAERVDA